jgi:hypothetical protein
MRGLVEPNMGAVVHLHHDSVARAPAGAFLAALTTPLTLGAVAQRAKHSSPGVGCVYCHSSLGETEGMKGRADRAGRVISTTPSAKPRFSRCEGCATVKVRVSCLSLGLYKSVSWVAKVWPHPPPADADAPKHVRGPLDSY